MKNIYHVNCIYTLLVLKPQNICVQILLDAMHLVYELISRSSVGHYFLFSLVLYIHIADTRHSAYKNSRSPIAECLRKSQ
jgi:hypothetical protein